MKRRPGFTRRAVNDHFSTRAASTAAPNGCRRSIAPPANPIYLCACHAAQGRARPGTPGMTLGTGCADRCSSRRIRELPRPTCSGYEAVASLRLRLGPDELVTSFGSVMSEARCDAGSARRQLEKRPAGVPIGGGAAFVPGASQHLVIQTIPYRPSDHPSRSRIVSHRRRVVFPCVSPRHRASDMTLLNVPLIAHLATANAESGISAGRFSSSWELGVRPGSVYLIRELTSKRR
jgi:hypothetical protein